VRFALQVFEIFHHACGKEQALVYRHQIARSVSTPIPKLSHWKSSHLRLQMLPTQAPAMASCMPRFCNFRQPWICV
jgi:hypothetical protein